MPTVLIALDHYLVQPGTSAAWPKWNKILACPPSDLTNHPWSNLGVTQDDIVNNETSTIMDKGKGEEKEVIEGGDEESVGPTMTGTVDNEEGHLQPSQHTLNC